jgi:threonine/homoserine efflux transporter RhtA
MLLRPRLAAVLTALMSFLFVWSSLAPAQEVIASVDVTGHLQTQKKKQKQGLAFQGTFEIEEFAVEDGEIVARGTISGQLVNKPGKKPKAGNVVTDVEVSIPVSALQVVETETGCQILALALGPVDLSLLELNVHLNEVVLDVTADPTEGILGDLLCALADLNGGVLIDDLLDALDLLDLLDLLGGLTPDELVADLLVSLNAGVEVD